jgi:hypothetical protein
MMTLPLVALLFITPCQGSFYFPLLTLSKDTEKGEIHPIIPKDDAFHGLHEYLSNEWWYFDAVFENGYGIHVGIKVISFGGRWGFVNQLINIYNQSVIEHQVSLMEPFDQFSISEEYPHVSFRDKPIMIFDYDIYNKAGKWNYQISVQIDHI